MDTLQFVLAIIVACLGSSGLCTIVVTLLQRHWKKQDEKAAEKQKKDAIDPSQVKAMVHAQKLIMASIIRYLSGCYIYDGKITLTQKGELEDMFEAYSELDGKTDHLDNNMEEVEKLPIVDATTLDKTTILAKYAKAVAESE